MRFFIFFILLALSLFHASFSFAGYHFFDDSIRTSYTLEGTSHLSELSDFTEPKKGRQALVVGAGPAGLIAALELKLLGFETLVLEKRSSAFNRLNMVNLKAEVESEFSYLQLLDDFRTQVATRLSEHRYYKLLNEHFEHFDTQVVHSLEGQYEAPISFHTPHTPDESPHFKQDGLYTVTIAELQQFLGRAALQRGVLIVTDLETVKLLDRPDSVSKDIMALDASGQTRVFHPDLIILTDGSQGKTGDMSYEDIPHTIQPHPCHHEKWIFGHVKYPKRDTSRAHHAFVSVLLDYSRKDFTKIANVIFEPRHQEVNIAVSVDRADLTPEEIREEIEKVAHRAFSLNQEPAHAQVLYASDVVQVQNKRAQHFVLGNNVLLAGDRAGVSSPLAGLGATLAVTSYAIGIRQVAQAVLADEPETLSQALRDYQERTLSYITQWSNTSGHIKNFIQTLPEKTQKKPSEELTPFERVLQEFYSQSLEKP